MRWVWLASRHARLSLRKPFLLPRVTTPTKGSNDAGRRLQSGGRRHVATKEDNRLDVLQSKETPSHSQFHSIEERVEIERGKSPPKVLDLSVLNEQSELSTVAEEAEQEGPPQYTRVAGPAVTTEHGVLAKLMEAVKQPTRAKSTRSEDPAVASYERVTEYPKSFGCANMPGNADLQLSGQTSVFRIYTPSQEPPGTSSATTGVDIDTHGRLRIKSTAEALRLHQTVLVVSSVSKNMVEADFRRLLPHTPDRRDDHGGLLQAIPGRDVDFNRLSYWILLFDSPYNAASFQHRLRWYHANATLNLPVDPYMAATTKKRELTPPEGYIDPLSGEDVWKRLHEFAVLLPTQSFNVVAMLAPFPDTILTNLRNHTLWKFPILGHETWPVRIWVDDHELRNEQVERFLVNDGRERGFKWDLVIARERIEPMIYTMFNSKGDRIDRRRRQLSKTQQALLGAPPQKNWVIRFRTENGALLFWRTWHRRAFPGSLSQPPGEERLLHVDPLW